MKLFLKFCTSEERDFIDAHKLVDADPLLVGWFPNTFPEIEE